MVSKRPPERRAIPASQLIEEAIAVALPDAALRGIRISVSGVPDGPTVLCDPVQIGQVLTNLMRNAADAMAERPNRRLKVSVRDNGQGSAEFTLSDSGEGLSDAQMSVLFQPFSTIKSDGMGLGLSICRTIVDNHGGKIWADRGDEGGALFAFTLPLAEGHHVE